MTVLYIMHTEYIICLCWVELQIAKAWLPTALDSTSPELIIVESDHRQVLCPQGPANINVLLLCWWSSRSWFARLRWKEAASEGCWKSIFSRFQGNLLIGISHMKLPMLQQNPRPKLLPSRGSTHNLCTNVVKNHHKCLLGCNSCNYSIPVAVQVVHSTSLSIHHLFIAFFGHWIFQEHQLANGKFRNDWETFGKSAKFSHSSRNLWVIFVFEWLFYDFDDFQWFSPI